MKKSRRTQILVLGNPQLAQNLAKQIESKYSVIDIEEASQAMVMIKMRDTAKKDLFYLGEMLVTESKIKIDAWFGIGVVQGERPNLSRWIAIIDAAYKGQLIETQDWDDLLVEEEKKILQKREKYHQKVLQTKVHFETMNS